MALLAPFAPRRGPLAALRGLLAAVALICLASAASAQDEAVTTHNAILRSGPRKASQRLGLVPAGDVVILLPHGHRTGYYRVRTQDEAVGWITEGALRKLDATEVHHPETPGAAPPDEPAAAVTVAAGAFDACPLQGDPRPGGSRFHQIEALNRLKNRSASPSAADLDSTVTLARMVGDGRDDAAKFDAGKAAEITGWVLHVKPGGRAETTNCRKGDPEHRDAHIELTLSPTDTLPSRRVIVEVTPRWRAAMRAAGVDWSTATLQHTIEHKWVRVRGWLLFDDEHRSQAENTQPGGDSNWRATVWEIHPITALRVMPPP
jgi:uncharacterized protein YgiM (DUF1202 family)